MNIVKLVIIASLSIHQAAMASDWQIIANGAGGKDSKATLLIDVDSIRRSKNLVQSAQHLKVINDPDRLVGILYLVQSNCSNNTYLVLKNIELYSNGDIEESKADFLWVPTKKGSIQEAAQKFVCETQSL